MYLGGSPMQLALAGADGGVRQSRTLLRGIGQAAPPAASGAGAAVADAVGRAVDDRQFAVLAWTGGVMVAALAAWALASDAGKRHIPTSVMLAGGVAVVATAALVNGVYDRRIKDVLAAELRNQGLA